MTELNNETCSKPAPSANGNRRDFIKKAALGGLGVGAAALYPFSKTSAAQTEMPAAGGRTPIIDMHLHCYAGPSDP
ncbi:MAG: twin-arginine translocation signal domain-containing protein, partial [Segetibacter sp.]